MAGRVRSVGRGLAATAAFGAAAGAAAFGYGMWEKNQFVLREESLAILPPGHGPIRVLHLSDIHFVPGQRRKAAWLASLADLAPDLVVNTGDNLSHAKAVEPLLQALQPLMEFPGVFVPGSNDYFAPTLKNPASYLRGPSGERTDAVELDWPRLRSGFGMGGWVDLTNRSQSLVVKGLRVDFSGVDDPHLGRERYAGWPARHQGPGRVRAPAHCRRPRPVPARPGPLHRGRCGPAARRTHPRRPDLPPGLRRPGLQLRPAHLAGQGTERLGKQRAHDAGERLRRHRHLALRPRPHRLQARGRAADAHVQLLIPPAVNLACPGVRRSADATRCPVTGTPMA